ncbi:MAG: AraC family transcriptional regulator, partial [Cyclobacteriaceae bacterium]
MGNVINVLTWFGVIQAAFLGLILLGKARKMPAIFLSILLLVEAIGLTEQALYFSGKIHDFTFLLGVSYPLTVLRPILIYFFARSYFQPPLRFKKAQLFHLFPLFLYTLLFSPLIFSSQEEKFAYLDAVKENVWTDNLEGIIFFIVNNIIYSTYYFFTWKIIHKAKPEIRLTKGHGPNWIAHLVIVFLYFFILKYTLFLLNGFHVLSNESLGNLLMVVSSFIIQIIAWFLISNSSWPAFNPSAPALLAEIETLKAALEGNKAFLDDDLTIKKLANQCKIKQDRLTDVIRMQYNETFKDVINNLRVKEAKALIQKDLNGHPINLLGIAMDSGFNNKVTFYRAFKRHEGVSPSEYLKKIRRSE